MKYLVIGSGGREHAIAWRLINDGSAKEVFVAPGNGGIDDRFRVNINSDRFDDITAFCAEKKIDMVVVGPEIPLVNGLVDHLSSKNIPVFGPSKKAAMLEGSKIFAKSIMKKYGVPTADHSVFKGAKELTAYIKAQKEFPVVIKLSGLAAGKGVVVAESINEALAFVEENVTENSEVFVEDFIQGEEVSVLGVSDGENIVPLIGAQDHKRIFDQDKGPNTGGMGAYAPAPVLTPEKLDLVLNNVLRPTVAGMKKEGVLFKGILYAGIIISNDKIKVLEFNARFGDPETQVILPLIDGKLGDIFEASVSGKISSTKISFKKEHAITVVISSGGYPGNYEKGKLITGLDSVVGDVTVFHAGTEKSDGKFYTNGGRVLNVTATGTTLREARDRAYAAAEKIKFEGAFYRKDIGYRAL